MHNICKLSSSIELFIRLGAKMREGEAKKSMEIYVHGLVIHEEL